MNTHTLCIYVRPPGTEGRLITGTFEAPVPGVPSSGHGNTYPGLSRCPGASRHRVV